MSQGLPIRFYGEGRKNFRDHFGTIWHSVAAEIVRFRPNMRPID